MWKWVLQSRKAFADLLRLLALQDSDFEVPNHRVNGDKTALLVSIVQKAHETNAQLFIIDKQKLGQ